MASEKIEWDTNIEDIEDSQEETNSALKELQLSILEECIKKVNPNLEKEIQNSMRGGSINEIAEDIYTNASSELEQWEEWESRFDSIINSFRTMAIYKPKVRLSSKLINLKYNTTTAQYETLLKICTRIITEADSIAIAQEMKENTNHTLDDLYEEIIKQSQQTNWTQQLSTTSTSNTWSKAEDNPTTKTVTPPAATSSTTPSIWTASAVVAAAGAQAKWNTTLSASTSSVVATPVATSQTKKEKSEPKAETKPSPSKPSVSATQVTTPTTPPAKSAPKINNKIDFHPHVKEGVNIKNLHPKLKQFYNDMHKQFPGLCITSGNDGKHAHWSRHYSDLAIDIGKWSSKPKAYNNFVRYLKNNEKELKKKYSIEDIIGLRGEEDHKDHIHIELPASEKSAHVS
jgi:hypothetical protein